MALWRWVRERLTLRHEDRGKWAAIYGHDPDAGEAVTPDTAMNLSAWWACRRLIAETIATLPCGVYRKDAAGNPQALPGHVLYERLHELPNDWQTPVEFWEGRVAPLCDTGNSYAEIASLGSRIVSLDPLRVDCVDPFRDRNDGNRIKYRVTDRGKTETVPAAKIFHIRAFGDDGLLGLSPLEYARRSVATALSADRAAAKVYGKGLRAPGFWIAPATMDAEQRKQFVENYVKPAEGVQGEGSARVVMPPGFDWKNFGITPKDAELLLTRGFGVEDVCRWMGVPPILIGHTNQGQTMWGSGVEQIILGWLVLGLRAYLKRIESAVNTRLMPLRDRLDGIYFEFNFEGLLRADSAGRAALMATLAQNGLRTRNELRKLDNLPALTGGDDLTVQSNLIPLIQLGEATNAADLARNSLRAWLMDERSETERKDKAA